MEYFANNYRATVDVEQTAGALTLTPSTLVGAPAGFPFRILVGQEVEIATALASPGVWTVSRGQEGTVAVAHAVGTAVDGIITAGQIEAVWAAVDAADGLPPVGDAGDVLTVVGGEWASAPPPAGGGSSDTPPVLADFAWVNQGTATAVDTPAGIHMHHPPVAGEILRMLQRPLPAAPYTITVELWPALVAANYAFAGIALRDNAGGAGLMFGIKHEGMFYAYVQPFNAAHTASAGASALSPSGEVSRLWLQLADDGTNRHFRLSRDGTNFRTLLTQGRAVTMTPTHYALALSSGQATYPVAATFRSVEVA